MDAGFALTLITIVDVGDNANLGGA